MTNNKKLYLNTITSVTLQVVTLVCGFVLPRLILKYYGSEVNGLVTSISQFLLIINFMEMGVGSVIRYNLYKPLVDGDNEKLSKVVVSAKKFYSHLASGLFVYIIILVLVYPLIVSSSFDWLYTAVLIVAMSINLLSQFYFGQVNSLVLTADQKGFIQYTSSIVAVLLNTIICSVLIVLGFSIQIVKLTTSLIFLLRAYYLHCYVKRKYAIDYRISYDEEPISQKWNGIAQHISAVVLDNTDVMVLTVFSTLSNVSIYGVYHLVINGIKAFLFSLTNGIDARIGTLIAEGDLEKVKKAYSFSEWLIHTCTVLLFLCTAVLIVPFVLIYTADVMDANYYVPAFSLTLTLANAGHCLRLPYSIVILDAGHYKQTQFCYLFAAFVNIVTSIVLVHFLGLIGVAIGTMIAMIYQTFWMANYCNKRIMFMGNKNTSIQFFVDVIEFLIIFLTTRPIANLAHSFYGWIATAIVIFCLSTVVILIINFIVYKQNIKTAVGQIKEKRKK